MQSLKYGNENGRICLRSLGMLIIKKNNCPVVYTGEDKNNSQGGV